MRDSTAPRPASSRMSRHWRGRSREGFQPLERAAILAGKTGRRAELIEAMSIAAPVGSTSVCPSLWRGPGVPLKRPDLERLARARYTARGRHTPSAIRCSLCTRDSRNPLASTAGTSLPVPRGARRRANAHRAHVPRADSDHAAVGERCVCASRRKPPLSSRMTERPSRAVQRQGHLRPRRRRQCRCLRFKRRSPSAYGRLGMGRLRRFPLRVRARVIDAAGQHIGRGEGL